MPTLIVENVPGEVYERLQKQAHEKNRTLSEEVIQLLLQELGERARAEGKRVECKVADSPRLPDPPILDTNEMSAPFDLPRAEPGVPVPVRFAGERLPEPFISAEERESNHV